MAISRVTNWVDDDILTAGALNGEFNNLLQQALALVSPLTGTLDANNQTISQFVVDAYTTAGLPSVPTAGRIARVTNGIRGYWVSAESQWGHLTHEVIDVKRDFGAKCDGTTDDSTAIQAAIDAVSTGGEIWIPGLAAIGTAGLLVSGKTDVTIRGAGRRGGLKITGVSTRTTGGFGATTLVISGCTNVRLVGLYLDGNSVACNAVGFTGCTESALAGCWITSAGLNASVVAVNNTRHRYVGNVVKLGPGTARGLWLGNTNVSEVEIDPLIEGNRVVSMGATGIGGTATGAIIRGNHCLDNAGSGIALGASGAQRYARSVISGNLCRGNAFSGIQSDGALTTDYTDGMTVRDNQCEENGSAGIYAVRARNWTIAGNHCRDNVTAGILVSEAKRVSVTGNHCYDTRAGGARTQLHGIFAEAIVAALDLEDLQIAHNFAYNNVQMGVYVVNADPGTVDGVAVNGNYAADNGIDGVRLSETSAGKILNASVVGNTCMGNATNDLRVSVVDAVIESNRALVDATDTAFVTFASLDATPSVKGRRRFKAANGGATTITTFDDGQRGQEILIVFTDANTTLAETDNIKLSAAFTSSADDTMRLVYDGTSWFELSRSVN